MTSRSPIPLTRRRLLAASGATLAAGAPVVLAACGNSDEDEDVSPAREAELLRTVLAEFAAVSRAADAALQAAPKPLVPVVGRLQDDLKRPISELAAREAELTETGPADPAARAGEPESAVEGLKLQLEQGIAVSIEAIGELPRERRQPVHRAIVVDAAALAAIRDTLGEEPAPDAFVMGPPASAKESS